MVWSHCTAAVYFLLCQVVIQVRRRKVIVHI
jgi:hypothetical protein